MAIQEIDGAFAIVRLELRPEEVPGLLTRHQARYPGAHELETAGITLVDRDFEAPLALKFVEDVCRWGGGDRLIGRVAENGGAAISAALRKAVRLADGGHVADAVIEVQKLPYLGQSFASKQLRFLRPGSAVILDSVIRTNLGYPENGHGYSAFLADCRAILDRVAGAVSRAAPDSGPLRICDVEAAIFAKLQGY